MHKKFAKDGLTIYSVVLDDPKEADVRQIGLRYLQKRKEKVTFPVVNLDMPIEQWTKKLGANSYPIAFVFNRDNKYVLKLPEVNAKGEVGEIDDKAHQLLDKTVADLLKK